MDWVDEGSIMKAVGVSRRAYFMEQKLGAWDEEIGEEYAHWVAEWMCKRFNLPPVKLVFSGRQTRYTHGFYDTKERRIVLNARPKLGIIVHELAHHLHWMSGTFRSAHDAWWQQDHERMLGEVPHMFGDEATSYPPRVAMRKELGLA